MQHLLHQATEYGIRYIPLQLHWFDYVVERETGEYTLILWIKSRKLAEDIPRGLFGVCLHKMPNYLLTKITFFFSFPMRNGMELSLHRNLSSKVEIQTRNPFSSWLLQQPIPDHWNTRIKQVHMSFLYCS